MLFTRSARAMDKAYAAPNGAETETPSRCYPHPAPTGAGINRRGYEIAPGRPKSSRIVRRRRIPSLKGSLRDGTSQKTLAMTLDLGKGGLFRNEECL